MGVKIRLLIWLQQRPWLLHQNAQYAKSDWTFYPKTNVKAELRRDLYHIYNDFLFISSAMDHDGSTGTPEIHL